MASAKWSPESLVLVALGAVAVPLWGQNLLALLGPGLPDGLALLAAGASAGAGAAAAVLLAAGASRRRTHGVAASISHRVLVVQGLMLLALGVRPALEEQVLLLDWVLVVGASCVAGFSVGVAYVAMRSTAEKNPGAEIATATPSAASTSQRP